MTAPDIIKQLVEKFDQHREAYRAGKYNETQLRNEFLNPFFEALGWDIFNKLGYSEDNKHVIHEDSLEIEGAKKAPDYAFKIGKERKFFVEAKKPSVKIETNPEVAFQLKRYVWSAKLPLGILTDFEEFAVYECRSKPKVTDSVKTGRVMLLGYSDYIEKWDEIAAIFSYNAVMTGGFDKFANSAAKKKGTAEVDSAFLAEIEGWRDVLARNIATRNKDRIHSEADLNYAVQMTIDRMIFLRICEDRGYESELQLQEISKRENIYGELKKLFERADKRYNSGLFHFKKETGRGQADTFTTGLEIDDKVLKDIIKDLYYPAPYVFALIPADILGQIYEQFLGKVIRLTASGNAKVEEKPEVRKAGGVYYTPTFIVDTIVKNTIGKLGEMMPKEVAKLKIVDPACGSGTFLLGAYQYLLDWHLTWYINNDPEKWSKGKNPAIIATLPQIRRTSEFGGGQGGGWKLSVEKKKEILLNNIYGVDIDPQAVEVTKLSLLLKVIEDPGQLSLLDERILPDLGKNIQCGNSLIGPDYWDGQLMVNEEERSRVNTFDWKVAFPEVFAQGGFDVVVGNPPYVFTRSEGFTAEEKKYFYSKFVHQNYQLNTFAMFTELAHGLMRSDGFFGFIIPNNWLTIGSMKGFRDFVVGNTKKLTIINNLYKVFAGANVDTSIVLFQKGIADTVTVLESPAPEQYDEINKIDAQSVLSRSIIAVGRDRKNGNMELLGKIQRVSTELQDIAIVKSGLKAYETGKGIPVQTDLMKNERVYHSRMRKDPSYRIYLEGRNVRRYEIAWSGSYLKYGKNLAAPRNHLLFEGMRILVRQIPSLPPYSINAVIVDGEELNDINSMVIKTDGSYSLAYLLALINSRLLTYWFALTFDKFQRKIFPQFKVNELAQFPIHPINFSDPAEKAQHDKMVSLVERMLALHKSLASARNPQEADRLTRDVESVDKSIDGLVYELYGLTEKEIKIVESR